VKFHRKARCGGSWRRRARGALALPKPQSKAQGRGPKSAVHPSLGSYGGQAVHNPILRSEATEEQAAIRAPEFSTPQLPVFPLPPGPPRRRGRAKMRKLQHSTFNIQKCPTSKGRKWQQLRPQSRTTHHASRNTPPNPGGSVPRQGAANQNPPNPHRPVRSSTSAPPRWRDRQTLRRAQSRTAPGVARPARGHERILSRDAHRLDRNSRPTRRNCCCRKPWSFPVRDASFLKGQLRC